MLLQRIRVVTGPLMFTEWKNAINRVRQRTDTNHSMSMSMMFSAVVPFTVLPVEVHMHQYCSSH